MYKIKLAFLSLFLIPIAISAQIFPNEGDDVGSLVPENYILKDVTFGDLNGDAKDDLVIVIRDKKTKIKSAAIYYAGSYSWELISESENFFLLENTDIFDPDITNYEVFNDRTRNEEYVYMSIEKQVITISTSDGWGDSINAKFRSNQSGTYDLIGIEIGVHERIADIKNSINYITHKMHAISTRRGDGDDNIDEEWYKISNLKKVSFHNFSVKKILSDIDQSKFEKI